MFKRSDKVLLGDSLASVIIEPLAAMRLLVLRFALERPE